MELCWQVRSTTRHRLPQINVPRTYRSVFLELGSRLQLCKYVSSCKSLLRCYQKLHTAAVLCNRDRPLEDCTPQTGASIPGPSFPFLGRTTNFSKITRAVVLFRSIYARSITFDFLIHGRYNRPRPIEIDPWSILYRESEVYWFRELDAFSLFVPTEFTEREVVILNVLGR